MGSSECSIQLEACSFSITATVAQLARRTVARRSLFDIGSPSFAASHMVRLIDFELRRRKAFLRQLTHYPTTGVTTVLIFAKILLESYL